MTQPAQTPCPLCGATCTTAEPDAPEPCHFHGCDGNADPRCKYRLCGTHCDEDCGRGDKCPRSDAKREKQA